MRPARIVVATVLATVATAACQGPGEHVSRRAATSASSAPSTTSSQPAQPTAGLTLSLDQAQPVRTHTKVLAEIPYVRGTTASGVLAVGADGTAVIKKSPDYTSPTLTQTSLVVRKPDGATATVTTPNSGSPQQAVAAVVSGRYVAWLETSSSEIGIAPWVLYRYDRHSGRVAQIAESHVLAGHEPPPPPGFLHLTSAAGRVFWAQVSGHPGAEAVSVWGCRISSCTPAEYATGAAFPAATASTLYVLASDRYEGKKTGNVMQVKAIDIASRASRTVTTAPLRHGQAPAGLAAGDGHVTWIISSPNRYTLEVLDEHTGESTHVDSGPGGGFSDPVAGRGYVTWAESSGGSSANVGGYLYEYGARKLFSVGNAAGLYNITSQGRYLSWQDGTPDGKITGIRAAVARLR